MSIAPRLLIQVLSKLTPGRCGISDQAVPLADELKQEFGIDSAFVILNSNERCSLPYPTFHCLPSQLLETCLGLAAGRTTAILVHVSGYGYSPDGAPSLLADALVDVKAGGQFSMAIYFHELYATGMPWRRTFWYSQRQRRAVRKIAGQGDLLITNTRHHADWLEGDSARPLRIPVTVLPVLSAAGEAQEPEPLSKRTPALAVFGLPASRQRAYRQLAALDSMLSSLGIEEIVDIGMEAEVPSNLGHVRVTRMGTQIATDLAKLFACLKFGFVPHEVHCLAKSTIFASYCALGTIPLVARSFDGEVDGLKDGVHVVGPQSAELAKAFGLENCSRAAWNWYFAHRLRVHAEFYAKWLENLWTRTGAETYALNGPTAPNPLIQR